MNIMTPQLRILPILRRLLILPAVLVASCSGGPVYAGSCEDQVPYGDPIVIVEKSTKLCRQSFMVIHDDKNKIPIITVHKFTKINFSKNVGRKDEFLADPELTKGARGELSDYSKSTKDYDRGHLVPFEDVNYSRSSANESYYLSNIAPQISKVNRGVWKTIESKVRDYSEKSVNLGHETYVFTGTITSNSPYYIGKNNVAVPEYFYKILLNKTTSEVVAFLVKNEKTASSKNWKSKIVLYNELRIMAGIEFMPGLIHDNTELSMLKIK